jgi:hypothetical protein
LLRQLNRSSEAEPLAREVLDRRRRLLGSDHPRTIASMNTFALVLSALDREAEAEPLFREALERRGRMLGPDHPDTLVSLHNVASNLKALGRPADAEPVEREALQRAMTHPALGASSEFTKAYAKRLAEILDALNRHKEADALRKEFALPATGPAEPK